MKSFLPKGQSIGCTASRSLSFDFPKLFSAETSINFLSGIRSPFNAISRCVGGDHRAGYRTMYGFVRFRTDPILIS